MRSEQEMMDIILQVAKEDERVRAVAMNGSRVNRHAPRDIFQDYDIVYLVKEMESFIADRHWIDVFGERIIMQRPDESSLFPSNRNRYAYLMLFTDGNRIDLTLIPTEEANDYVKEDKLTKILLDKDRIFPNIPPPTDEDYRVKKPTAPQFADCCNEFLWVSTYVAKGLWRMEPLYALDHLNGSVRSMLLKMIEWKVGIETDFSVSVGKSGKYLQKFLSDQEWNRILSTFPCKDYDQIWESLFASVDLFRETARFVAEKLSYPYPSVEDFRVTEYLKNVRALPAEAKEFP